MNTNSKHKPLKAILINEIKFKFLMSLLKIKTEAWMIKKNRNIQNVIIKMWLKYKLN